MKLNPTKCMLGITVDLPKSQWLTVIVVNST